MNPYRREIDDLIRSLPFEIDTEIQMAGHPPTMASSDFLTNKEQGDWAEKIVMNAINENSPEYLALPYGRTDSIAAGDTGFAEFYLHYQEELNRFGKKPDLLIFRKRKANDRLDLNDDQIVGSAIAAIEVRSSSFLANKYAEFMNNQAKSAEDECKRISQRILSEPLSGLLLEKCPEIHRLISQANAETFKELDFRARSWCTTQDLQRLTDELRRLKRQIKILHKRDYLSITPKLEDIALVNRWINRFNVRHYYLQVFFDKAYLVPFKDILRICSDPKKEGTIFSVERDVKNQRKTTIKINVKVGKEILGRIEMPEHQSAMKELDRGRLLFYVTFEGGKGYLDAEIFKRNIIHDR